MNISYLKTYFQFSRIQRKGIFVLLLIILILQFIYFFVDFSLNEKRVPEKEQLFSMQGEIDSLKLVNEDKKARIFFFNPNFITDYKGYKLGMSVQEIDRLLAFRKENKYVNSAEEFQKVTKISDSLLKKIAPSFKFPNWIANKKGSNKMVWKDDNPLLKKTEKIVLVDINLATQQDLMKIYGIGEALSGRIIKQKESFEAFVSMEQLDEVWGLSPQVVTELKKHFGVVTFPKIRKIAINDASLNELAAFPYFRYTLAKKIITYRSMNGNIGNIEDLVKIKGFPLEKAPIIDLYLKY